VDAADTATDATKATEKTKDAVDAADKVTPPVTPKPKEKPAPAPPAKAKEAPEAKKGDSGGKKGDGAEKKSDTAGGGKDADAPAAGGSCKTSNSFIPGTLVLMADGSTKPIEDVETGDKVLATDPQTGETTAETVTAEIKGEGLKHLVKLTVDTDGSEGTATDMITATDGHPFWVPELGEWIDATDLKSGQWLRTSAGTLVQITAVEHRTSDSVSVHNLTVDDAHTYYALAGAIPVLVHNCNLSARASEIHATEPDEFIRKNVSTVAVIRADTPHGPINVVAGSGDGLTPAQMSAIGKGEIVADNIPDAHAEQNALLFINQMGWTPISGGTSRNVCLGRCAPLIRGTGGKMMGEVYPGNGKTTTRQRSFEW
jgi:hypothetical protein